MKTLNNGATVLDQKASKVLCSWNGEFVCWTTDGKGNAYWGHYFNTLEAATTYFYKGE